MVVYCIVFFIKRNKSQLLNSLTFFSQWLNVSKCCVFGVVIKLVNGFIL